MNNTCQINISGTDYYVPCDYVSKLDYIDGYLVNVGTSSITLKSEFSPNTTYPNIQCSSMSVCNLRTANTISNPVTSNYTYSGDLFRVMNFEAVSLFVLLLILGVKLLWKR